VDELDGAINGFQVTVAGVDGDSLLGDLPAIVSDLGRIDTAWTALEGQINQTCGWPGDPRDRRNASGPVPRLVQSSAR
jgi:hypothetical protein